MQPYFDHEKLAVYQEAIAFVTWWTELRPQCSRAPNVQNQLDRASTSAPLNIAEGNGKFSMRDRARYLQIASGSALECAACLDVLVARKCLTSRDVEAGKRRLQSIVAMLIGLINSVSNRVAEGAQDYDPLGNLVDGPTLSTAAGTPTPTRSIDECMGEKEQE